MFSVTLNNKHFWQICTRLLFFGLFSPAITSAAEIKLISDSAKPSLGSEFTVAVVAIDIAPVTGVDLRWQFDPQDVAGSELLAKKLAEFQWHRVQKDPPQNWAVTSLMLPQSGQSFQFQPNDTLAVLHLTRLSEDRTTISLKSGYPILIDDHLNPISCVITPLVLDAVTAVTDANSSPTIVSYQVSNYPNPFNPETQFVILSGQDSPQAELVIYDLTGRIVSRHGFAVTRGVNKMIWKAVDLNGQSVPAGVYFYRIQINRQIVQGKCVIIK